MYMLELFDQILLLKSLIVCNIYPILEYIAIQVLRKHLMRIFFLGGGTNCLMILECSLRVSIRIGLKVVSKSIPLIFSTKNVDCKVLTAKNIHTKAVILLPV